MNLKNILGLVFLYSSMTYGQLISPIVAGDTNRTIMNKWNLAFEEIDTNRDRIIILENNNLSKSIYAPVNGVFWFFHSGLTKSGFYITQNANNPLYWRYLNSQGEMKSFVLFDPSGGVTDVNAGKLEGYTVQEIVDMIDNTDLEEAVSNNTAQIFVNSTSISNLTVVVTNNTENIAILWDEVYYISPDVLFVSGGSTTVETGSSIGNINLSFNTNKEMVTRNFTGFHEDMLGPGSNYTYTLVGPIMTTNATLSCTITVTDIRENTDSAVRSYVFANRIYYGKSEKELDDIIATDLHGMSKTWAVKGRSGTQSGLSNEYIYIAYPFRLGLCSSFSIGGFATDEWPYTTKSIINESGYSEIFIIYRSHFKQNGDMSYAIN